MADNATQIASDIAARLQQAWNAGDGNAIGGLFTADGSLVHGNAMHDRGAEAVAQTMSRAFAGPLKGSTISLDVVDARALQDDVVLAHATLAVSGGVSLNLLQTLVLVRDAGAWRIAALQSTPIPQQA